MMSSTKIKAGIHKSGSLIALLLVVTLSFNAGEILAKKTQLSMKTKRTPSEKTTGTQDSSAGASEAGNWTRGFNFGPLEMDSLEFAQWAPEISFSGFDKPYNSKRETFLVTNGSPRHIAAMEVRITYLDPQGRMLHSRVLPINMAIPPGETRQASVKSFDSQSTYYYIKSRPPRNSGQPFQVTILPLKLFVPR